MVRRAEARVSMPPRPVRPRGTIRGWRSVTARDSTHHGCVLSGPRHEQEVECAMHDRDRLTSAPAKPRILFVDDEPTIREHLADALSLENYVETDCTVRPAL